MARIIKRYPNRKLYDASARQYVTLEGIADLVRAGESLRVVDNASGEDLTALTFAQILVEEQKRPEARVGTAFFEGILRRGEAAWQEFVEGMDRGREALEGLAVRGMGGWTPADPAASGREFLAALVSGPQRQFEEWQQRLELRLRSALERLAGVAMPPADRAEIEHCLRSVEEQVLRLRPPTMPPPSRPAVPKKRRQRA